MDPEGSQPQPQNPNLQPNTPAPSQPATTSSPAPEPSPLKQIRTFQGDVAEAIQRQNESVASIQRAEVAKRDAMHVLGPQELDRPVGHKGLIYTVLSFILVGAGILGAWYSYSAFQEKTAPPVTTTPANQLVGAQTLVSIDASVLSRSSLLGLIGVERQKTHPPLTITQLQLLRGSGEGAGILTSTDFFTRLNIHAPDSLIRALNPVFMLGLLGGEQSHAFLLVRLDSFENAFPGMLAWESRLAEDLLPLFATEAEMQNVPSSTAFTDVSIANRDTRVLKDTADRTVLLYAFFDNKLLIVTDGEEAFRAIISRLQSEKLSR